MHGQPWWFLIDGSPWQGHPPNHLPPVLSTYCSCQYCITLHFLFKSTDGVRDLCLQWFFSTFIHRLQYQFISERKAQSDVVLAPVTSRRDSERQSSGHPCLGLPASNNESRSHWSQLEHLWYALYCPYHHSNVFRLIHHFFYFSALLRLKQSPTHFWQAILTGTF